MWGLTLVSYQSFGLCVMWSFFGCDICSCTGDTLCRFCAIYVAAPPVAVAVPVVATRGSATGVAAGGRRQGVATTLSQSVHYAGEHFLPEPMHII